MRWSLQKRESRQATGPGGKYSEILKGLEEEGKDLIRNEIHETGIDVAKASLIALPKVPGTLDCSLHRTNMSYLLNFLSKIILQRIRQQLLPEIPREHFSSMNDRNAFFAREIHPTSAGHYLVFKDYQKAS